MGSFVHFRRRSGLLRQLDCFSSRIARQPRASVALLTKNVVDSLLLHSKVCSLRLCIISTKRGADESKPHTDVYSSGLSCTDYQRASMNQSIAVLPTSKQQQQSAPRDCPSHAQASSFPLLTDVTFESEQDATRFLKLPHPRTGASISPCLAWTMIHNQQLLMLNVFLVSTGAPALFLPASKDSEDGNVQILLEVQAVNATGDKQRSWFTRDDKVIGGA